MTSFMQTMFVAPSHPPPLPPTIHTRPLLLHHHSAPSPSSSPSSCPPAKCRHHYPGAAKPLSPLACNVFAVWPQPALQSLLESPSQKQFKHVLQTARSTASLPIQVPSDIRPSSRESDESSTATMTASDGSPVRRERPFLPRSKAGARRRPVRDTRPDEREERGIHSQEPEEDEEEPQSSPLHGLGFGLDFVGLHADLLTCSFDDYSNANARTRAQFKPQRSTKGSNAYQLKQFAEATLGNGSLKKVVKLPEGEDRDEWLAVNIVDFYNQINLLYGAITEFCSPQTCPEMKATEEFEYLWHDPPTYAKPTRLPAPKYISNLLTWTSDRISNPQLFPTQPGVPFPAKFQDNVRQIFKRLYRVYAHIYCHHYSVVRGLGLEAHLNTGFKHYVLFVEEFGLAETEGEGRREWFGPLGELVESMVRSD